METSYPLEKIYTLFSRTSPYTQHQYSFSEREAYIITEKRGNNAFCWKEGDCLYVPACVYGDIDDIEVGESVVFREQDNGILYKERGLKKHIITYSQQTKTPLHIVDNHNHVLESWEKVQRPVFHIDQHRDDALCLSDEKEDVTIANYIDFALKKNIIPSVTRYTQNSEYAHAMSFLEQCEDIIVNIDLDIFAKECTHISFQDLQTIFSLAINKSVLITFATSPLFFDQHAACSILKKAIQQL